MRSTNAIVSPAAIARTFAAVAETFIPVATSVATEITDFMPFIMMQSVTAFEPFAIATQAFITTEMSTIKKLAMAHYQTCLMAETGQAAGAVAAAAVAECKASKLFESADYW